LLLVLVDWLQWRSLGDYRDAREWVTHTRIVLLDLESFLSLMNDAETGQRGYLLTHRESYLTPYENALNQSQDQFQTLRHLTLDNPQQQKNLDLLAPLVKAKFDELAQTIALEKNSDHEGALKIVLADFGKNTMDQIRALLSRMHDNESDLLRQREAGYQETARRNSQLSGLVIAIGIIFIVVIVFLLLRMERMHEMIKICAWSKLIEYEGEWISVEDYLMRRFKIEVTHGMSEVEAKKMMQMIESEKQQPVV
jgi:CHASE3 domain sensor protein